MFHKTFVIAEIGINHNGSMSIAKDLIDKASRAKCDCIKFQIRNLDEIYKNFSKLKKNNVEQSTQYIFSELKKSFLTKKNYYNLLIYCKKKSLKTMVTPFDLDSVEFIKSNTNIVDYVKIGSPDFDNLILLEKVISLNKRIFLSTGMNTDAEINSVIKFLNSKKIPYNLLHCSSSYPAFDAEINLNYIKKLKKKTIHEIGYSGHEKSFGPTMLSIFLGAKIIERHITISKKLKGPDHTSSLNYKEFKTMVADIRKAEFFLKSRNNLSSFINKFNLKKNLIALGSQKKIINQNVLSNKIILGKSLIYKNNFCKSHILKYDDFDFKSPAKGFSCLNINKFINKKLLKNVKQYDYVNSNDFPVKNKKTFQNKSNKFISNFFLNKKWGLVSRLGDFENYIDNKADLLEIHLTWRELVNFTNFKKKYNKDLVIHAPEYFNDQLVDFTTSDIKIRNNSFEMLDLVLNFAKNISNNFEISDSRGPRVIIHPGGHYENEKSFVNKKQKYINLITNLKKFNLNYVRLLIENMPPYPWYFGGRFYNYIFTDPLEIKKFSKESSLNICYDVSHAQLYCNLNKMKLSEFTRHIKPYTSYLHIADAGGLEDEGLQIGEGNVDFLRLFKDFADMDLGFIPEIWHGHLNSGYGFELALKNIKKILNKVSNVSKC
jgi:N-acetylneuraminate synthase